MWYVNSVLGLLCLCWVDMLHVGNWHVGSMLFSGKVGLHMGMVCYACSSCLSRCV